MDRLESNIMELREGFVSFSKDIKAMLDRMDAKVEVNSRNIDERIDRLQTNVTALTVEVSSFSSYIRAMSMRLESKYSAANESFASKMMLIDRDDSAATLNNRTVESNPDDSTAWNQNGDKSLFTPVTGEVICDYASSILLESPPTSSVNGPFHLSLDDGICCQQWVLNAVVNESIRTSDDINCSICSVWNDTVLTLQDSANPGSPELFIGDHCPGPPPR